VVIRFLFNEAGNDAAEHHALGRTTDVVVGVRGQRQIQRLIETTGDRNMRL